MFRCKQCHFSTAFERIMSNHLLSHPVHQRMYYNDTAKEDLSFNPFNGLDIDTDIEIPDVQVIDSDRFSGGGGDFSGGGASSDY
jgi:hypothetical protein